MQYDVEAWSTLEQLDHGGTKCAQIVETSGNDVIDLVSINLPVHMDQ